jgi:hypothetical protein
MEEIKRSEVEGLFFSSSLDHEEVELECIF